MIYFAQSGTDGPVKIGCADDIRKRMRALQTGNPDGITLLAVIPGGLPEERKLHLQFAHLRQRGEWFIASPALRRFIAGQELISGYEDLMETVKTGPVKRRRARQPSAAKIDVNAPAYLVVEKFGGLARFCELSGIPSSTVWGWVKRGDIPFRHVPNIKMIAARCKPVVKLKDSDFLRKVPPTSLSA